MPDSWMSIPNQTGPFYCLPTGLCRMKPTFRRVPISWVVISLATKFLTLCITRLSLPMARNSILLITGMFTLSNRLNGFSCITLLKNLFHTETQKPMLIFMKVVLERKLKDTDKLGGVKMLVWYERIWVALEKNNLLLA